MKRLLITSTDLMMVQFLVPHVKFLSKNGYSIDIACSEVGGRFNEVLSQLKEYTSKIHRVCLQRSPLSVSNLKGLKELKRIINSNNYDLIWTNEPVMGVMTRLAAKRARRTGTKVIYMAHGFHFYNGAPLLNWCIYYPIEKIMATFADLVCTINSEDYNRAQTFKVNKVKYIHGIGFRPKRFEISYKDKNIKDELLLKQNDFIVVSIGELNKNKNQATIIEALRLLQNPAIHYVLCGKGNNEHNLKKLVNKYNLNHNVHFLGYRKDILNICSFSDIYAMPSKREGLGLAVLEAMYCGLPLATSYVGGLKDLNKDGINGFLCKPTDYKKFAQYIKLLFEDRDLRKKMGEQNRKDVIPYTIDNTLYEVKNILDSM